MRGRSIEDTGSVFLAGFVSARSLYLLVSVGSDIIFMFGGGKELGVESRYGRASC